MEWLFDVLERWWFRPDAPLKHETVATALARERSWQWYTRFMPFCLPREAPIPEDVRDAEQVDRGLVHNERLCEHLRAQFERERAAALAARARGDLVTARTHTQNAIRARTNLGIQEETLRNLRDIQFNTECVSGARVTVEAMTAARRRMDRNRLEGGVFDVTNLRGDLSHLKAETDEMRRVISQPLGDEMPLTDAELFAEMDRLAEAQLADLPDVPVTSRPVQQKRQRQAVYS